MWKRIIGFTALCSSLSACSGGDAGNAFPGGAGGANGGATSGGGGSDSGGATNPASGGTGSGGARGGAAGNVGNGGNGGAGNGGAGGASGASAGGGGGTTASGGVMGAGGAIPRPYCNGQSADLATDMYNCGVCGKICQPSLVASGLNAPGSVIADSTYVYWAEHTANGRVFRVPLGAPSTQNPTAIATNQKNPHALVASSTNVYWITDDAVWTRPIGSGSAASIATDPAGRNPGDVALDGTHVYFTIHSDTSPNYAAVKKMPLAGGAAVEIATLPVTDFWNIAVNGTKVFFVYSEHLGTVTSQRQNEIIYAVPLGGGTPPVELYRFTPYVRIRQLIANEQYLYIGIYERQPSIPPTVNDEARVMRLALTGGEPVWIVGALHEVFAGFDINAQGTFLAANNGTVVGGSIASTPNGIGMSMALSVPTHPTSLSVTETHIYYSEWEDNGLNNGTVYRNGLCVGSVCQ